MSDSSPSIRLCPEHLCELFWNENLIDKIDSGEWREQIVRSSRGGEGKAFQPFRDHSGNWVVETQEITWIEIATNEERVRLNRFITDTGHVGASGYPDPKRIRLGPGRRWSLTRPPKNEPCAKCGRIGHAWPDRPKTAG